MFHPPSPPPELGTTPPRRNGPAIVLGVLALLLVGAFLLWHHRRSSAVDEVSAAELQDVAPVTRSHFGRRLERAGNTVLHGAGQTDLASFRDYTRAVAPARPTLFMTYVDLRADVPAFFAQLRTGLLAPEMRGVVPQIGLSLTGDTTAVGAHPHYEAQTARGDDDRAIDALCTGLVSLGRPAFLRPGYEFNGPWNGYRPTSYIAAFRRIAARVHGCAPQVALVWDWSADAELDTEAGGNRAPAASRWQPFYPGDDAVDWWAVNLFSAASIRSAATAQFLRDAERARFPVMIAESTPKGYTVATSPTVWDDWFQPYFTLVHRYPNIRAFCYINWNWAGYPQWADWGDARVETAPAALRQRLRTEVERPLYAAPDGHAVPVRTP